MALYVFLLNVFRASGEAIVGTPTYFLNRNSRLLIFSAAGEAILGTQRYFSNHFLINFCFRLRRGDFGYTTILYQGNTTRYYDKIVNNSLSNIFVQLIYRGEVLRSITCYYVLLCFAMFFYVFLCFAMFCYVFAMFCYVFLCFCYVFLCFAMFC